VSLASFQRAVAELVASPERCRAVAARPSEQLANYDLSVRERNRLLAMAAAPGMAANCMLYRANRLAPIASQLPLTCHILGSALAGLLERYWVTRPNDLQPRDESRRFAAFLQASHDSGALQDELLPEVLGFELAALELRYLPRRRILRTLASRGTNFADGVCMLHPLVRVVPFSHPPDALLRLLARAASPPFDLERGEFWVVLERVSDEPRMLTVDTATGRLLRALSDGARPRLGMTDLVALADMGFVVPEPSAP
jgi:hypothetical protein